MVFRIDGENTRSRAFWGAVITTDTTRAAVAPAAGGVVVTPGVGVGGAACAIDGESAAAVTIATRARRTARALVGAVAVPDVVVCSVFKVQPPVDARRRSGADPAVGATTIGYGTNGGYHKPANEPTGRSRSAGTVTREGDTPVIEESPDSTEQGGC